MLLDMDGTLLDLHFDNHFGLSLVPAELSRQRNLNSQATQALVESSYDKVFGTLDWYYLNYWKSDISVYR